MTTPPAQEPPPSRRGVTCCCVTRVVAANVVGVACFPCFTCADVTCADLRAHGDCSPAARRLTCGLPVALCVWAYALPCWLCWGKPTEGDGGLRWACAQALTCGCAAAAWRGGEPSGRAAPLVRWAVRGEPGCCNDWPPLNRLRTFYDAPLCE